MEYDYIHDSTTGQIKAKFSLEHQILGPWLEVELSNDKDKLEQVLAALDVAIKGESQEQYIAGQEYSLIINADEVKVAANASLTENGALPEHLAEDGFAYDGLEQASCGLEDFRECLLTWARFSG